MIYYKFPRPGKSDFTAGKTRFTFERMYVPHLNDPTEKFCFAEILKTQFEDFLEDFGADGEVLDNDSEFPTNFYDSVKGRLHKFQIIEPLKN